MAATAHVDGVLHVVDLAVKEQESHSGVRDKQLLRHSGLPTAMVWARTLLVAGNDCKVRRPLHGAAYWGLGLPSHCVIVCKTTATNNPIVKLSLGVGKLTRLQSNAEQQGVHFVSAHGCVLRLAVACSSHYTNIRW